MKKLFLLALIIAGCSAPRPMTMRVIFTRDGYTYASSSYRTYRAKLDTVLKRGTIITACPTRCDTCKNVFIRVN